MIDPIDSSSSSLPPKKAASEVSPLESKVNRLFFDMIVSTDFNNHGQTTRFERSSNLLSTLLWVAKYGRLDPQTTEVADDELTTLSNNMVWSDVERTIRKIVDIITSSDHRVEIIELLMELEHLFCIKPPENQKPIATELYQEAIGPLMKHMKYDMTLFEIRQTANSLRSLRNRYLTKPDNQKRLLKELKELSESKRTNPEDLQ